MRENWQIQMFSEIADYVECPLSVIQKELDRKSVRV
jgi:hypothetical protein